MNHRYSIGIIGSSGIMGSFFVQVFRRYGVEVFEWGRKSNISLRKFCTRPDIILVSVPIDRTVSVIEEVGKYTNHHQCICDITSLKKGPLQAMQSTGKKYFGMHPMFAPPRSGKMEGQNVIFCQGNAPHHQSFIEQIFRKESAVLLHLSAQEHDEIMSVVQGLSHFLDISFIQTLRRKNVDLEKVFASRSPAYALKMMLAGRTLYQDSNLYGNIQIQNPENKKTLQYFFEEAKKLFSVIQDKDLESFDELFNSQKKFLGEYADLSQKESDVVIDFLSHRILTKKKPYSCSVSVSKNTQSLGILGPADTFSHLAAQQFFGDTKAFSLYPSIASVFSGYVKGEISEIFVPIENILHGSVAESIDGMSRVQLPIQAVYEMKIIPALFTLPTLQKKDIEEIFSHPQSLAQCSEFLEREFPNVHITPVSSTATAISRMRSSPCTGAIAPQNRNSDDITLLYSDIANQSNNATRFAYLSRTPYRYESKTQQGGMFFSFSTDSPGNLESVLRIFSKRNINLTKIESRPTGKAFGEYLFFVIYEGGINPDEQNQFFKEIESYVQSFSFLGEFGIFSE